MATASITPLAESAASMIGHINFDRNPAGKRSAGKPPATFDVAGIGDVAWLRYGGTRRRKGESTVNTNINLHRRASPRPYLRGALGETPEVYSLRKIELPVTSFFVAREVFGGLFGTWPTPALVDEAFEVLQLVPARAGNAKQNL